MSWTHLKTLLWLRWRLSRNRWKRAGTVNLIFSVIVVAMALVGSVIAFFAALIGGILGLGKASPDLVLLLWGGIAAAFLFVWTIGLVAELQRSELLSMERLLHMPISLREAYLLNYVSSFVSLSIVFFLPGMVGLGIAMTVHYGLTGTLVFPLAASFVVLVTAVTYQLRGWLATLMANKRRRRTIIALVTAGFILLVQLPNLVNMAFQRARRRSEAEHAVEVSLLHGQLASGVIDRSQFQRQREQLKQSHRAMRRRERDRLYGRVVQWATIGSLLLPPGWLPYGARAAAAGNPLPPLLGSLGMALLAAASLRRSYRSTMRFHTGQHSTRKRRRKAARDTSQSERHSGLLQCRLIGVSERASIVALATFQSLMRAPEAKMVMLTPVILAGVFGSMLFLGSGRHMPVAARPFVSLAAVGTTMFGISQLMINMFGFDRGGFRALILMPAARKDILLGKNLAVAPLGVGLSVLIIAAAQLVAPLSLAHLLATLLQIVPAYLFACLVGNAVSIVSPMPISAGSLKPAQPSVKKLLVHMVAVMLLPIALVPAAAAVGCESLLRWLLDSTAIPVYLPVSLAEAGLMLWLYRVVIRAQGRWLQKRETRILESVAAAVE
jgi:hypothetical protein